MASLSFLSQDQSSSALAAERLLFPALHILDNYVRGVFRDGVISDFRFVELGVLRVLSQCVSGRDFLQQTHEVRSEKIARSSFFDTLHSPRRLRILSTLNTELVLKHRASLPDLLEMCPELKQRPIYAVDGHHIAHAVHSLRDKDKEHVSSNSLYVLCLHSGLLMNLGAVQGGGLRKHEMPVFRARIHPWIERHSAKKASRPIFVADPAFIDKAFWSRMNLNSTHGALVITRTKENMKPTVYSSNGWKTDLAVNQGVVSDQTVGFDGACLMRRVTYVDPESTTQYQFLTTVMDLAPGLIALLYLLRWRIEKLFDTSKNKLQETKAWATGQVAQEVQAHFTALTHNLLVLLREELQNVHAIREVKVEDKKDKALDQRKKRAIEAGRTLPTFHRLLPAIVQLTAQFLRTLRNSILTQMRWATALTHFRRTMESYL